MTLSPTGVAYEIVSGGDSERDAQGLVPHEVRFWDSEARRVAGDGKYLLTAIDGKRSCDLMNSFKMQIRTNHQRIVTLPGDVQEPDGYMRHVSGLLIPQRVAVDEKLLGEFLTLAGKPLGGYTPFMFPTYAGVDEPLSGMWQHVRYDLNLLDLADANIERYIAEAIAHGWEGDRRGTTLNLQVGASGDDGYSHDNADTFNGDGNNAIVGAQIAHTIDSFYRFISITGLSGVTIDSASISLWGWANGQGNPLTEIKADDTASPTAPTSLVSHTGKTRTTNAATWDGETLNTSAFTQSPSIVSVMQEIVDSHDPSAIQILHDNDNSSRTEANRHFPTTYDGVTSEAPKLDIDHSPGGAPTDQEPSLIGGKLVTNSVVLRHLVH